MAPLASPRITGSGGSLLVSEMTSCHGGLKMNQIVKRILIIGALVLAAITVSGQQVSDIDQLRAAIQKLESVARDDSVPAEVKELNQRFLKQRRAQLQTLLRSKISALQAYRSRLGSTLSSDEMGEIERSIQALTRDLEKLGSDLSTDSESRSDLKPAPPPDGNGSTSIAGDVIT